MGTIWIIGAERLGDGSIGGPVDSQERPARVVWHTTETSAGNAAFNAVAADLIRKSSEPHVLYDPTTDLIGQFGPLDQSARALRNDGTTRTNRTGKVCIQIEVLGRAGTPFTGYWKPGPNFRALMDAIRSWGIPDRFPMPLADHYGDSAKRDRNVWLTTGGHYGHCNVPGNEHWDPGAIDTRALFAAAPVSKPITLCVDLSNVEAAARRDPGLSQGASTHKADVLLVEKALRAEGLLSAAWVDGSFGTKTREAYAAWQRRCGYSGSAADGIPGATTLRKLGARHRWAVRA